MLRERLSPPKQVICYMSRDWLWEYTCFHCRPSWLVYYLTWCQRELENPLPIQPSSWHFSEKGRSIPINYVFVCSAWKFDDNSEIQESGDDKTYTKNGSFLPTSLLYLRWSAARQRRRRESKLLKVVGRWQRIRFIPRICIRKARRRFETEGSAAEVWRVLSA